MVTHGQTDEQIAGENPITQLLWTTPRRAKIAINIIDYKEEPPAESILNSEKRFP